MKHGRTDRDWAVVAALTFIAGVVVTWGITGDETVGSWLRDLNWSAWVQAAVALVVGYAAVIVPKRIAEAESHRRATVVVALLRNALTPAAALSWRIATNNLDLNIVAGLVRDIEIQLRTLDSYPAADVPSAELLQYKVDAEFHCLGVLEHFKSVEHALKLQDRVPDNLRAVFGLYHEALSKLVADIGASVS